MITWQQLLDLARYFSRQQPPDALTAEERRATVYIADDISHYLPPTTPLGRSRYQRPLSKELKMKGKVN